MLGAPWRLACRSASPLPLAVPCWRQGTPTPTPYRRQTMRSSWLHRAQRTLPNPLPSLRCLRRKQCPRRPRYPPKQQAGSRPCRHRLVSLVRSLTPGPARRQEHLRLPCPDPRPPPPRLPPWPVPYPSPRRHSIRTPFSGSRGVRATPLRRPVLTDDACVANIAVVRGVMPAREVAGSEAPRPKGKENASVRMVARAQSRSVW